MAGINVQIMPCDLSDRAWKWYCNSDVFIKAHCNGLFTMKGAGFDFVMNGVRYYSYKEVLDKIESMAEEFERIEKED